MFLSLTDRGGTGLCRGRVSFTILLESLFGVRNRSALNGFFDDFHEKRLSKPKDRLGGILSMKLSTTYQTLAKNS